MALILLIAGLLGFEGTKNSGFYVGESVVTNHGLIKQGVVVSASICTGNACPAGRTIGDFVGYL